MLPQYRRTEKKFYCCSCHLKERNVFCIMERGVYLLCVGRKQTNHANSVQSRNGIAVSARRVASPVRTEAIESKRDYPWHSMREFPLLLPTCINATHRFAKAQRSARLRPCVSSGSSLLPCERRFPITYDTGVV